MRHKNLGSPVKTRSKNKSSKSVWKQAAAGAVLFGLFAGVTVLFSSAQMPLPDRESELIISFKVEGAPIFADEQENNDRLDHMQRRGGQQQVEGRADVAVQVATEETVLFEDRFRPKGIFRRGYSSGIIYIPLEPGTHTLDVQFGDYIEGDIVWNQTQQKELEIKKGERVVLKFNDQQGFRWYSKDE